VSDAGADAEAFFLPDKSATRSRTSTPVGILRLLPEKMTAKDFRRPTRLLKPGSVRDLVMKAGAVAFLTKPVRSQTLLYEIDAALKGLEPR